MLIQSPLSHVPDPGVKRCCTYLPAASALEMYWGMACLKALMSPDSYSLGRLIAGASWLLGSSAW